MMAKGSITPFSSTILTHDRGRYHARDRTPIRGRGRSRSPGSDLDGGLSKCVVQTQLGCAMPTPRRWMSLAFPTKAQI